MKGRGSYQSSSDPPELRTPRPALVRLPRSSSYAFCQGDLTGKSKIIVIERYSKSSLIYLSTSPLALTHKNQHLLKDCWMSCFQLSIFYLEQSIEFYANIYPYLAPELPSFGCLRQARNTGEKRFPAPAVFPPVSETEVRPVVYPSMLISDLLQRTS